MANLKAVTSSTNIFLDDTLVWISYLPLAHVYERLARSMVMQESARCAYYRNDPKKLFEDCQIIQPTYLGGVPRIWNRVNDGINAGIKQARAAAMAKGVTDETSLQKLADTAVYQKFRAMVGGHVRQMSSGAAPLRREVYNNLVKAFDIVLTEAYGQTECCAAATTTLFGDPETNVGPPIACNAIKLVSVPEMNYFSQKDQGEVCIKGHNIMKGYYKNPEKTAETIDAEGWLHTGDIGEWTPAGALRIIDRVKNIFKTSLGEYIAPEKIENIYVLHPAVMQCFVYGNSLKNSLVGVFMKDPEVYPIWLQKSCAGFETDVVRVQQQLLAEIQVLGKMNGLKSFENVKIIRLIDFLMTPENGLLTPTSKTKRAACSKHFENEINEMYAELKE